MAAVDHPGECELVLYFASAILGARIQQILNLVPAFARHERFIYARICGAVPIKIAGVQAFSQDLMDNAALESPAAELEALRVHLLHQGLHRVAPPRKSSEYVSYQRCRVGVGYDRSLAVGAIDVPITYRRTARVDASTRLLGHPLASFLAEIQNVVARHQNVDAMR